MLQALSESLNLINDLIYLKVTNHFYKGWHCQDSDLDESIIHFSLHESFPLKSRPFGQTEQWI